ncbi:MAG: ferritin-like domain-containing protein [Fimbriimonas sp.]
METSKERLIRYLQDAHAAETGIQDTLEGFISDCNDPDILELYKDHLVQTISQARRLEDRLRMLDATPSTGKGFLNSMMAKASEFLQAAHDDYDRNTQNLIKAYATEHLERAMYESLYAFATAIGDTDTARLAREIQLEEAMTAEKLFPLIEQYAMGAWAEARPQAYSS